jgi:hypothetical protein
VGAVECLNRLLLQGRELRLQRLPEIPIAIRREGCRLVLRAPLGRELLPPPRDGAGVHQVRTHEEQQRDLPRQLSPEPRSLVHHPLPALEEALVLAPELGADVRDRGAR